MSLSAEISTGNDHRHFQLTHDSVDIGRVSFLVVDIGRDLKRAHDGGDMVRWVYLLAKTIESEENELIYR